MRHKEVICIVQRDSSAIRIFPINYWTGKYNIAKDFIAPYDKDDQIFPDDDKADYIDTLSNPWRYQYLFKNSAQKGKSELWAVRILRWDGDINKAKRSRLCCCQRTYIPFGCWWKRFLRFWKLTMPFQTSSAFPKLVVTLLSLTIFLKKKLPDRKPPKPLLTAYLEQEYQVKTGINLT